MASLRLRSPEDRGRLICLAGAALALAGCGGGDDELVRVTTAAPPDRAAATPPAVAAEQDQARAERAARRERRAERRAQEQRAATRARSRGDSLLGAFIDAGTRDRWSVMTVTAEGGAVAVRTDLPPGNTAAFAGACAQVAGVQAWISSVSVIGTDGHAHASWRRGDQGCTAGPG